MQGIKRFLEWYLGVPPAGPGQGTAWNFGYRTPWPAWLPDWSVLRDRAEDIPLLAQACWRRLAGEADKRVALGADAPRFAHEALLVAAEGKLSKRLGSYGAEHLREEGVEPLAMIALLARIGTSQPVEPVSGLDELAESFDFAHFGRAPAHFDPHDVELLNARLLHHMDFDSVADRLPAGTTEGDWLLLRPNLVRLGDFAGWRSVIDGDVESPILSHDDRGLVREAAHVAAGLDWGESPWKALTRALAESSGRKGRALFMPLRQALTGRDSGPEMAPLLARIGKDRAIRRLEAAAQR